MNIILDLQLNIYDFIEFIIALCYHTINCIGGTYLEVQNKMPGGEVYDFDQDDMVKGSGYFAG